MKERTEKQKVAYARNFGKFKLKGVKALLKNLSTEKNLTHGEGFSLLMVIKQIDKNLLDHWDLNNKDFFGLGKRKEFKNVQL
jgi:hypothetical protein